MKINDYYYRVISSGKKDEYLLGEINSTDPTIEKVEINNITFLYRYRIKLVLELLSLVFVINTSRKGNLTPLSASNQIQNYALVLYYLCGL